MTYYSMLALPLFLYAARIPDPPIFTDRTTLPMRCYLSPDSGLCPTEEMNKDKIGKDELQERYYFDLVIGKCYPFRTQNCGGNENRFENLRKCQSTCTKHKHTLFRQLRK